MSQRVTVRDVAVLATLSLGLPARAAAQQRDTIPRPSDSLKVYTLPPAVVSVTRANPPIRRIPQAVELVATEPRSTAPGLPWAWTKR